MNNKLSKSVIAAYAVTLFIYVFLFLVIPFEKNEICWLSFAFTVLGFIISLLVCGHSFSTGKSLVSKLYGYPIFRVGLVFAVVQMVLGILFCFLSSAIEMELWVPLIFYVLLFALFLLGFIATDAARSMIMGVEEQTKAEIKNVTLFRLNAANLVELCEDAELKKELEKLNEQFRFSDPVSSEQTKPLEDKLMGMMAELRVSVETGSAEEVRQMIRKVEIMLNERNRVCKAMK